MARKPFQNQQANFLSDFKKFPENPSTYFITAALPWLQRLSQDEG